MAKPVNWEELQSLKFIEFTCQCPDFTKRMASNPNNKYAPTSRDWSNSDAGVRPEQWCKHIWATVINNGWLDLVDIPTDYALEEPQKVRKGVKPKNFATNRGDSF